MKRTEKFDLAKFREQIVASMKQEAATGTFSGRVGRMEEIAYMRRCTFKCPKTSVLIIFTRDVGHHESGWFKNPDYERCFHLSTSAQPPRIWTPDTPEPNKAVILAWVEAFFGDDIRYVWCEGPFKPEAKKLGVQHWRLFCNPAWEPIKPRKEVYTREFTEKGWKSFSDIAGRKVYENEEP